MTASELLREWALNLKAAAEHFQADSLSVVLKDGTAMEYESGEGLTVIADGRTLEVPESALEEERWSVA